MNIRKMLRVMLWIVVPIVSNMLAGLYFAWHGFSKAWLCCVLAITILCMVEAAIERRLDASFGIPVWLPEILTGVLVFQSFQKMATWLWLLCVVGTIVMIGLTIAYIKAFSEDIFKDIWISNILRGLII